MLNLTDEVLWRTTKDQVQLERETTLDIVQRLREIERRKLHLERGFSSMFSYATEYLKYSPDAERKRKKIYTAQEKRKLVESFENKSSRDVQRALAELSPQALPPERERALSADKTAVQIVIDEDLRQKIAELKGRLSHVSPNMSHAELLGYLVNKELKKLKEIPKVRKAQPFQARYIPAATRRAVWTRDHGRCTYKDPITGHTCGSRYQVQLDHLVPFALGGQSTAENLALKCGAHNRWAAEQVFGVWRAGAQR